MKTTRTPASRTLEIARPVFLALVLLAALGGFQSVQAVNRTWNGSVDGNWSGGFGANWTPVGLVTGDALLWTATSTANKNNTNDITGLSILYLKLDNSDGIVLNGNDLTATASAGASQDFISSTASSTVNLNLTVTAAQVSCKSVLVPAAINGVISGAGTTFTMQGAFILSGLNTFSNDVLIGNGSQAYATTVQADTLANANVAQSLGKGSLIQLGGDGINTPGRLVYRGGATQTDKSFRLGGTGAAQAPSAGVLNNGSGALTWAGTQTLQTAHTSTTRQFTLGGFNGDDNTWQTAIQNNTTGGLVSFDKAGTGKWILSGANTFTGSLTLEAGTLVLDYTNTATVVPNTTVLIPYGGTLEFKGNSNGSTAQTLGNVTMGSDGGLTTFRINQNGGAGTTVTLGTVTPSAGRSCVLFDLNGATDSSAKVGTGINPDTGTLASYLIRTPSGAYDFAVNNGAANALYARGAVATIGATDGNGNKDYIFADTGNIGDGAGNISAKSLRIAPTLDGQTMTINNVGTYAGGGGGGLMLAGTGLLYDGGARDFTITSATGANGVSLRQADSVGGLFLHHMGTGKLTIGERVYLGYAGVSPGAGSAMPLCITGRGLIDWQGGCNVINGTRVIVHGATVRISGATDALRLDTTATGRGSATIQLIGGGIVEAVNGDITRNVADAAGALYWKGDGGFSAYGAADRAVNLGGNATPTTLTWGGNGTGFVQDYNALVLCNSKADRTINFRNPLALGALQRLVRVHNGSATVDAKLSGVLSSQFGGGLVKDGDGTLELTATNTYYGATWVKAGTLRVSGTAGQSVQGTTASGLVTVFNGGAICGTGTAAKLTLNSGAALKPYDIGNGVPSLLTVTGALTIDNAATLDLTGLGTVATGDRVLITSGTRSGTFADPVVGLPAGRSIIYTGTSVILKAGSGGTVILVR